MDPKVEAIFDWLVDGCQGASTPMDVLARLGADLRDAGLPVERVGAAVRTLHPHIAGRAFTWVPGKPVDVMELPWSRAPSAQATSPVGRIFATGEEIRVRLEPGKTSGWPMLDELIPQGFTDYFGLPLRFMGGTNHAISYATRAPEGFSAAHAAILRHITRPLSRVAETLALTRTAANLLTAYVGRDAGDRILKGSIRRGDTESIRCVIWFSDLRGFTSMSNERPPQEIIGILNDYFDCQVPAIETHGGEVLKFMGDGLLAIFPVDDEGSGPRVAAAAVDASAQAFAAMDRLNGTRSQRGHPPLAFGVGLHIGEVAFGNIGGASRLDFTAIGPAVNLASRIEGLTSSVGKSVLLSAELAAALGSQSRPVGTYSLKGVAQPQAIFEPGR